MKITQEIRNAYGQNVRIGLAEKARELREGISVVKHDLAIVGGGLLGRLLAWRAALSGLGVALYDANDRLGNKSAHRFKLWTTDHEMHLNDQAVVHTCAPPQKG